MQDLRTLVVKRSQTRKQIITRFKEFLEDKLQMASPQDSENIIFHQTGTLQDTAFEVTFFPNKSTRKF